jgi:hypothetical protein
MTRIFKILILALGAVVVFASWRAYGANQAAPVKVEGCVSCHGLIEPMHKYGTTETLEKLKDGKDAVGLSCTACHGGNPVARTKEDAHVKPLYPREWRRDGKYTGVGSLCGL